MRTNAYQGVAIEKTEKVKVFLYFLDLCVSGTVEAGIRGKSLVKSVT